MAAVLELHPPSTSGPGWLLRVAPRQRLELGLLIGADHVLVLAELDSAPEPLVEIEHPSGLDREIRIAREDPRPVLPGLDRVLMQPAPHRRSRHRPDQPFGDGLRGQLRGTPPRQRHLPLRRWLARHRLDLGHHLRGERPRPPRPARSSNPATPDSVEPLAPHADHIDVQRRVARRSSCSARRLWCGSRLLYCQVQPAFPGRECRCYVQLRITPIRLSSRLCAVRLEVRVSAWVVGVGAAAHNQRPCRKARSRSPGWNRAGAGSGVGRAVVGRLPWRRGRLRGTGAWLPGSRVRAIRR